MKSAANFSICGLGWFFDLESEMFADDVQKSVKKCRCV
jgi:hypothetical protein